MTWYGWQLTMPALGDILRGGGRGREVHHPGRGDIGDSVLNTANRYRAYQGWVEAQLYRAEATRDEAHKRETRQFWAKKHASRPRQERIKR